MMKNKVSWIIGKLFSLLYLLMAVLFSVVVWRTQMVPGLYFGLLAVVLAAVAALVIWLTWSGARKVRYGIGIVLSLLFSLLFAMGSIYVGRTLQAADKITTVKTEVAEMGIYVQANNTDDFNQTASGYTYGILAQMDRENTDQVVEQLNEQLGISIAVKEYDSLTALMDGLFGGETNAVILNSAYLDVLEEMEGYENIRERIREVTVTHVETEVPQASLPAEEAGGSQDQSVLPCISAVWIPVPQS